MVITPRLTLGGYRRWVPRVNRAKGATGTAAANRSVTNIHTDCTTGLCRAASNFEDLQIKSTEVIEDVVGKIREVCGPLGHKVYAVVNYDGFEPDSDFEAAYLDVVQEMGDTYFHGVTRFTTSAFMCSKLGSALESRGVAPHIYESEDEAAGAAAPPCHAVPPGPRQPRR